MPTYLFDTNALQSIGRQVLTNCRAQGYRLIVSTITCFELVSHLDDANFHLARGNARKGLLCEVLHDPLGEIMLDVGCESDVHPGRLDDQPALIAILNQLELADTYADFMQREVDLIGQRHRIGDIARNLRTEFDCDRQRFVDAMRARCRTYVERYGREAPSNLRGRSSAERRSGWLTAPSNTLPTLDAPRREMPSRIERFWDAVTGVARVCMYIASVGVGQQMAIDGNDYEDYLICLHMGVSNDRIFVTNDGGVDPALDRTITAFAAYFSGQGRQFVSNSSIITPQEFIARFPAVE